MMDFVASSCRRAGLSILIAAVGLACLLLAGCGDAPAPLSTDDTLMLTWQGDPTTSIVVQWLDNRERDKPFSVSIATLDADRWRTVGSVRQTRFADGLWLTRVMIDGLAPGCEYRLRVRGMPPTYRFRTMPAALSDEPIVFVSGGDVGVNQHAEATMQRAAAAEPHFALIGGDIAYADNRHPEKWTAFLEDWRRLMVTPKGRLIPLLVCIGNHELDGEEGTPSRTHASYFYRLFALYDERNYNALDFGDYMSLVLMDSGMTTPVEGDQTQWLERTLATRAEVPNLFVAYHVAAYPSFRDFDNRTSSAIRASWCPLFDRYGVETVFEHHDHTYKRTVLLRDGRPDDRGVLYLGDGAWGESRQPKTPDERPYLAKSAGAYHFIKTAVYADHHVHTAIESEGDVIDEWSSADPAQQLAVPSSGKPQS